MPATAVLEFRGDIRDFAEVLAFYHRQGVPITTKSEVVRRAVSDLADMIRKGKEPMSYSESGAIVERFFQTDFHSRGGRSTYLKELALEDLRLDVGTDIPLPNEEEIAEHQRKIEEMVEGEEG